MIKTEPRKAYTLNLTTKCIKTRKHTSETDRLVYPDMSTPPEALRSWNNKINVLTNEEHAFVRAVENDKYRRQVCDVILDNESVDKLTTEVLRCGD